MEKTPAKTLKAVKISVTQYQSNRGKT